MALIDKETICAEIERIMSRAMDKEGQDICEYILEFLDTLPEQPVKWSEEDIKKIRSEEYTKGFNDAAFGGKLKEWSEEDEKIYKTIYSHFTSYNQYACSNGVTQKDIIRFLESLPEQPVTDCHDLEEEIDNAIYGGFYSHCRVASGELPDREPGMYVQIKEGGPWLPVNDWKHHRYIATDDTIKRIARHFAEWGAENLKR